MGINKWVEVEDKPQPQPEPEMAEWELELLEAAEHLTDDDVAAFQTAIERAERAMGWTRVPLH